MDAGVLFQQEFPNEHDGRGKLKILVLFLGEAVAFIIRHQVPHRRSVFANRRRHLLAFVCRHAGIVTPSHDEHGFADLADVVDGRDLLEEGMDFRVALVAILHATQIPPVRRGALEKAHEIRNPDNVHCAA